MTGDGPNVTMASKLIEQQSKNGAPPRIVSPQQTNRERPRFCNRAWSSCCHQNSPHLIQMMKKERSPCTTSCKMASGPSPDMPRHTDQTKPADLFKGENVRCFLAALSQASLRQISCFFVGIVLSVELRASVHPRTRQLSGQNGRPYQMTKYDAQEQQGCPPNRSYK